MKNFALLLVMALVPLFADDQGYTPLFNGKDLTGWKVNENA